MFQIDLQLKIYKGTSMTIWWYQAIHTNQVDGEEFGSGSELQTLDSSEQFLASC